MAQKITSVRDNLIEIGNDAKKKYDTTNDLKAALVAVKAYGEATKTAIAQIRYKDKTGTPAVIDFLEEE
jgi:hypothetical protein